jgi:hypothetical protein
MQSGVSVEVDNLKRISEALKALGSNKVLVGIPQENDPRPGEPIGNVSLAYIHNLGSPARNIPARPHIVPGIVKSKDRWLPKLEQAAHDALAGEPGLMKRHLGEAGQIAVNAITQTIQAGVPPPLAQATVDRRRIRTPGSKYRRKATTAADVTPLIDTADYLHAIIWVWG